MAESRRRQLTPSFIPGPVLFLGAPGVGKGTQARLLNIAFGIPQISTGDLLRDHRRKHTELGRLAEEKMQRGELVPDYLVNQMVADRLARPDCLLGYILDGFPRTLAQANWLDQFLVISKAPEPVVAISIHVAHDELLRRVTGRRICPQGHIFNLYTQPPMNANVCDFDGQTLEQRSDDTESVFEQRMKSFHDQTAPVINHYRRQGRFCEVDGAGHIEEVTASLHSELRRLRERSQVNGSA